MRITFNPYPLNMPSVSETGGSKMIFGDVMERNVRFVFSGKSALALLLRYYRETGRLQHKMDQVLVPEWLGYWVYMTMQKYCFPTTVFNNKVRGILLYHQWGFPQDISAVQRFSDRMGLFCIEDCAHAFYSHIDGRRLGTFGDASIFSLAKFFSSIVGGAVYSSSNAITAFVGAVMAEDDLGLSEEVVRRRFECEKDHTPKNAIELERNYAIYDKLIRCPDVSLSVVRSELERDALERRRTVFRIYREAFRRYDPYHLFDLDVLPWAIPLFMPADMARRVIDGLRLAGVESGSYRFDIRRNMLEPEYVPCVGIPCHQGITDAEAMQIIDIVSHSV